MNKKLLAVAVAGVLAAPAAALAQSSVTISGVFKLSFDNVKLGGFTTAAVAGGRGAGGNSSESRISDESSAIRFNVVEDLGGGLQAIGQIDWRVTMDVGADAIGGNNHVGLRSKTWGRLILGRQDIHYFNRESNLTVAGSLKADSISLLAFAGGGGVAIANATRTPNIIHYTTPNWGGFTLIAAYSTNPIGAAESDIGSGLRKGRGWHLNPNFQGSNFQVGYSYVSAKADGAFAAAAPATVAVAGCAAGGVITVTGAAVATNTCATSATLTFTAAGAAGAAGAPAADQRGDRLYGSYRWGGLHVGLAWDKSKLKSATTGVETSNRTAWSLPIEYTWGNHGVYGHYTKARDDKAIANTAAGDQSAKMFAITYGYWMSKRTSLGLTYAKLTNSGGAAYNLFTNSGGLGNAASTPAAGEDPRIISATVRHTF